MKLNRAIFFNQGEAVPRGLLITLLLPLFSLPFPALASENLNFSFTSMPPRHAPASDSHFQYNYNAVGNLKLQSGADGVTIYHYTPFNKLKKVEKDGETLGEYVYGVGGTRIARLDPNGTIDRYFGAVEKQGSETTHYFFLGGSRVAKRKGGGSLEFFHQDHLGSTSVITSSTGDPLVQREHYEYGALKAEFNLSDDRHDFGDKRLDQATRLHYFEARSLDSAAGRFIQADPIVPDRYDPQSYNRYAYVSGNPLKYVDPTGHFALDFLAPALSSLLNRITKWWKRGREENRIWAAYYGRMEAERWDSMSYQEREEVRRSRDTVTMISSAAAGIYGLQMAYVSYQNPAPGTRTSVHASRSRLTAATANVVANQSQLPRTTTSPVGRSYARPISSTPHRSWTPKVAPRKDVNGQVLDPYEQLDEIASQFLPHGQQPHQVTFFGHGGEHAPSMALGVPKSGGVPYGEWNARHIARALTDRGLRPPVIKLDSCWAGKNGLGKELSSLMPKTLVLGPDNKMSWTGREVYNGGGWNFFLNGMPHIQ